jgi:hypothetical protein
MMELQSQLNRRKKNKKKTSSKSSSSTALVHDDSRNNGDDFSARLQQEHPWERQRQQDLCEKQRQRLQGGQSSSEKQRQKQSPLISKMKHHKITGKQTTDTRLQSKKDNSCPTSQKNREQSKCVKNPYKTVSPTSGLRAKMSKDKIGNSL